MLATKPADDGGGRHREWDVVLAQAPRFAVTAWRYLDQLAVSMRPATVDAADNTLRCFAGSAAGRPPARNTIRQRFGLLRSFFERIIEWGWDDATMRIPIFTVDVPVADDPLPRFLDMQATRLAAAFRWL